MYPSKILLFGEYSVLFNSYALGIPFTKFQGKWDFKTHKKGVSDEVKRSNINLIEFWKYISVKYEGEKETSPINLDKMKQDLNQGLYFKSNIPNTSGLGSSGALIAAILDKYPVKKSYSEDGHELKEHLSLLESFYHLTSSGIDPLISYLKSPVLLINNGKIILSDFSTTNLINGSGLFLVDSKLERSSKGLIEFFKQKCRNDPDYMRKIIDDYIPLNNNCIVSLAFQRQKETFFAMVKVLSIMQMALFSEMIPPVFLPLFKYGINNDLFFLKLCGAGGGGFFLGFTGDTLKTKRYFNHNGYKVLFL